MSQAVVPFTSVYGPVQSWRLGRSLGIDPIGSISTCSFDCVYCQLGAIEHKTDERREFISTAAIVADLQAYAPWNVDMITLSGSGEPTLALNLGDILTAVKALTAKPVAVLTNGSLLHDPDVQQSIAIADYIAVKVDAVTAAQFRRVNRPVRNIDLLEIWEGIYELRQRYIGHLAIQTMLLTTWSDAEQVDYITLMQLLAPDEIQLNTPTRPKPFTHELTARGNHGPAFYPFSAQALKPVSAEALHCFGDRIYRALSIPVRCPGDRVIER